MMIRTAAFCSVLLAVPLHAQDLSNSTALLTHFATRCGQIASDPTQAVSGIAGASARIAGDRSLVTHQEPVGPNGKIAFRLTEFAEGKSSDCALALSGFTPGQYDDLGKLIAENGSALFGTEVIVSGSYLGGDAVQMIATAGYPPSASLTHVQSRDTLDMVLSLNSAAAPAAQPTPAPQTAPSAQVTQPAAPQPQVLEVAPEPQPAALTPEQLAIGDDMVAGLASCLNASADPTALAPALMETGFAFSYIGGSGEMNFEKGQSLAQLSSAPRDGFCTLIAASAPYALAQHVGDKAAQLFAVAGSPPPATTTVDGCPATTFTGPNGLVTLTYINPSFRKTCDDPLGAAVRLSLK